MEVLFCFSTSCKWARIYCEFSMENTMLTPISHTSPWSRQVQKHLKTNKEKGEVESTSQKIL